MPPVHTDPDPHGTPPLHPRDPSPAELGRRIKLLRIGRGLTLKDLEERGGISATHVSEIERGKASPTVGALARIARALGLRPAALLEPSVLPPVSIRRAGARSEPVMRIGAAVVQPAAGAVENGLMSAHLVTLPMGREPAFAHQHEGEEWTTVLAGVTEIRIDGQVHVLRDRDSLHFRSHHVHTYTNLASIPAVLMVTCRPRLAL
jgi:transcriptional regulator with XRE-family HTH domain